MIRRTKVAASIAVIAAIAAIWWWRHRAPEGFIVELVALDDGTALVVWRANYDHDPSREWLAHFDHAGALDWSRELPGLTAQRGVLVVGDVITVRYHHVRDFAIDEAVAGFALRDGKPMWDRVLSPLAPGTRQGAEPMTFWPAFSVAGTLIEQVMVLGEPISYVLYAIDPRSGKDLGHVPVHGEESIAPMAIGDRVVLREEIEDTVRVVDTSHGIAVTDLNVGSERGCVIGEDYVTLDKDDLSVVAFRHADPTSRRVLGPRIDPAAGLFLTTTCGRYRDRVVFEMLARHLARSETSIAVMDARGSWVAMIPMPFSSSHDSELTRDPEVFGFAGTLPRFVPYLTIDDTKDHDYNQGLAMVDLEQARVAWVAKTELDMPDEVFRHDDRWYLDNSITGGVMMEFDGASGALVAAVDGGDPVQPSHIAGGTLWRFRDNWSRLDKAPLAALDAKTLAPIFARGFAIADVTKQTRDALGVR